MNVLPSLNPIQIETIAPNLPVSEGAVSAIGSLANGLLEVLYPVGSIMYSMLTPSQLALSLNNPTPFVWVLADGGDATGSAYASLTGNTTLPDFRGLFVRGKNGPSSTTNPDGDLPLGTYTADKLASHTHQYSALQQFIVSVEVNRQNSDLGQPFNVFQNTEPSGGNETAPTCVTVNIYIRIN